MDYDLLSLFKLPIDIDDIPLPPPKDHHSVILEFNYGLDYLDEIWEIEKRMSHKLVKEKAGFHDGHELGMNVDHGYIFLYGENAEIVFKSILPIVQDEILFRGGTAYLTFGPNGAEITLQL